MKKKKLSKEASIGIFTVAVLIGAFFGFNFLKSKNVFNNDYTLYAYFNQASGLENSASVIVQGFKVGTVEDIEFDISKKEFTVKMNINGDYRLPANSVAKIASSSMLGGKAVIIDLGSDQALLENKSTIKTSNDLSLMDNVEGEFNTMKENLAVLVDKVNGALDGINRALSTENTEALTVTMNNLSSVSGDLKQITGTNKDELSEIINNLSTLSTSLSNAAPELERGIGNLASVSDALAQNAPNLVEDAAKSVESLNAILAGVQAGEGSVGKLVTDEEFYNNANATLNNLALLLEDLKENPKKYINVSVFGSKK